MDTKGFKFSLSEMDEKGIFDGYAAVFDNIDRTGDVIEKGAFNKTLKENPKSPILWQHDPHEPIGITLNADEDDKGMRVKGQLNLETTKGREAYALLKQGALKGLSIGYETIKENWDGKVRHLKEIKLWEWSLVTFPANPLAQVDGVKAYSESEMNVLLKNIVATSSVLKGETILSDSDRSLIERAIKSLQALTEPPTDSKSDDHLLDELINEIKNLKEAI